MKEVMLLHPKDKQGNLNQGIEGQPIKGEGPPPTHLIDRTRKEENLVIEVKIERNQKLKRRIKKEIMRNQRALKMKKRLLSLCPKIGHHNL
jgi:hypothetical protein